MPYSQEIVNASNPGRVDRADGTSDALRPPEYQARGPAAVLDRQRFNNYVVGQSAYPEDLLSNPQYGGNYVVFYINVYEDSMLISGDRGALTVEANLRPRQNSAIRGLNISETVTNNVFRAGVAGATLAFAPVQRATGLVYDAASKVNKTSDSLLGASFNGLKRETVGAAASVADAAIAAGAAAVAVDTLGGTKREMKELKQAIALHLPTDLATRYGMQWEETDLAGTTAILATSENLAGALKEGAMAMFSSESSLSGALDQAKAGGTSITGYGISQALRVPGVGEAISKLSGVAANPKKEQLFKQVDFRTFSFQYDFFPKSATESQAVQKIIQMFKYHMHPEFKSDSFNFMYIYPSEFDIVYYHQGRENLNLPRHTSCVLTDMNVLYTPQGVATTFPDGASTHIRVVLTFKELAILTKENIADGF